ncbi:hypothetical protein Ahy_B10g102371 [Arachis hypogaea]|uniref:Protein FAR1-RELATED SEQUENCE n=1 Tax=Arachis hypogaea TaxID=3818 RepID=A0A444X1K0_ARAHY|nr:hypothetical protein Ahy_B10g102371 [Arachis hypogaea]
MTIVLQIKLKKNMNWMLPPSILLTLVLLPLFRKEYTHGIFNEFQKKFRAKANCFLTKEHEEGYIVTYKVIEEIENGDKMFHSTYEMFQRESYFATLSVLGLETMKKLPNKYILDGWKKILKCMYSSIKCSHDPSHLDPV